MSVCFSVTYTPGEVVCTIPCPEDGQYEGHECPNSQTNTSSVKHKIGVNVSGQFGVHSIPLLKTDREFLINHNKSSSSDGTQAILEVAGSISESIKQTRCVFHYINSSEDVCLYRKTETNLSFSGEDSGCVAQLLNRSHFAKIKVSNLLLTQTVSYVLLRNGGEEVLSSFVVPFGSSSDVWKMFLSPTPDLKEFQYDEDIATYGFYNDYDNPIYASFDSKVALDGGPDMFYPEWARDWTQDPLWEQVALHKFTLAKTGIAIEKQVLNFSIPNEPVPIGDFARHPQLGDMYSWLVQSGLNTHKTVNYNNGESAVVLLENLLSPKGIDLKEYIAFYPISIY